MLCRYHEVVCLRDEHLDEVESVAEVVLAGVQRLLFYYLVHVLLVGLDSRTAAGIPFDFLVKLPSGRTALLLLYYEVWPVGAVDQWVFANVGQDLLAGVLFLLPRC